MEVSEMEGLVKEKSSKLGNVNPSEWFEPVFREIDEAVFGERRVLVHCQAGQSRSASILAAYLIRRIGVTSEQAIAFLRSRRPCVGPKFAAQLKMYHAKLYPAGGNQS